MAKRSDSVDYERGRRDGLRLAIETLAVEEAKWAAQIGLSRASRTNAARKIRCKAYEVAGSRLRTLLHRLSTQGHDEASAEVLSALDKAGL